MTPRNTSNEAVSSDKRVHITQPNLKAALITESGLRSYIVKGSAFILFLPLSSMHWIPERTASPL